MIRTPFLRPADQKAFSTAQAIAALRGVQLIATRGDDGRLEFVASAGAVTEVFDSVEAAAAWLDRRSDESIMMVSRIE